MVAGLDAGAYVEHGVGVEDDAGLAWPVEGQRDAGSRSMLRSFRRWLHVPADGLAVRADPDDADLGAAIAVDGGQVGWPTGVDQLPELVWRADHKVVPRSSGTEAMRASRES